MMDECMQRESERKSKLTNIPGPSDEDFEG